ncbi:hypothetical protein JJL45_13150 [Tamlana sp. s12]|nr:hypothetical protein [Tamlana sp. s12]QQY81856.1 hypothetical protein JJL45_13150 [Tamlana sp. s12]
MISSLHTFSQQGAYHDAMIEEKKSGGQFPFIIGLIVVITIIYFSAQSDN